MPEGFTMRETLRGPQIHNEWTTRFHDRHSAQFFEEQFDAIASEFRRVRDGEVLDAGSGPGHHTVRLARRGFDVVATDFSAAALGQAQARMEAAGLSAQYLEADLTALPFSAQSFSRILCYGVLMHVPDLRAAVHELARVLAPGGSLVVSEGSMHSLDDITLALLLRLRGRRPSKRFASGLETLIETDAGPLLIRHANIDWLVGEFESHGLTLRSRRPGMLTESFTQLPRLSGVIHTLNRYYRRFGGASLAFGNLLVFTR